MKPVVPNSFEKRYLVTREIFPLIIYFLRNISHKETAKAIQICVSELIFPLPK